MAYQDIGENLVGSYLRYVEGCPFVVYNTQVPGIQGEIDVTGMKIAPAREVVFCEVTTHIRGTLYGSGYDDTIAKIRDKIERARGFAQSTMADWAHRYEIWSPVVPVGKLTDGFAELETIYSDDQVDVTFVINGGYTQRIQRLIDSARSDPSATSEPAYRLLQVLTHLRGELRV